MNEEKSDPLEVLAQKLREDRERYSTEVLNSKPFQDALSYLKSLTIDFTFALNYVCLQGSRFNAGEDYLLFHFAPRFVESVLAIQQNAKEGLQNAARRELRFILEGAVKLSCSDTNDGSTNFEERLEGLGDRNKRFADYVAELRYFEEFEKPEEANAEILSLYSELSTYVHATIPQLQRTITLTERGEPPGMESVSTLNAFNRLAFRVYDLTLLRLFFGLGIGLAGDIFTVALDDDPRWRFHKGKFVGRMSRCFDYKHERRVRRGELRD